MKNLLTGLLVMAGIISANAQKLQYNRFSTTPDGTNIDGSVLTNLNASNLSTGTVADGRLTPNVTLNNGDNIFTGVNEFSNWPVKIDAGATINGNVTFGNNQTQLASDGTANFANYQIILYTNGNAYAAGSITAGNGLFGSGQYITGFNASKMTKGTVADSRPRFKTS